jgi:glycosyltransferase involved in cell wall biosynthesis
MSRLLIDVTELKNWKGKLTGVPRVMDELASRFANDNQCIFVEWNHKRQKYYKTSYEECIPEEEAIDNVSKTPTHVNPIRYTVRTLNKYSRVAQKSTHVSKKVVDKISYMRSGKTFELVTPVSGDTLLIMTDWHGDKPFIKFVEGLKSEGVKLIQICYDMLPAVAPQYSSHATKRFIKYVDEIYPICDLIFAISESAKNDVSTWLQNQSATVPPIVVIRLGDDYKGALDNKTVGMRPAALEGVDEFILCVGTIEARKNHALIYYAYKLAAQRKIKLPPIAIVGRLGWLTENIYEEMTVDPETKGKFIFLHRVDDDGLSWLYNHALFNVYPSFYEGWGLPIAEAVSRGVPSISSSISSMPEIAGDLINYFSPYSSEELLRCVLDLLEPGAIESAKQKLKSYKPTSWDQTFSSVSSRIKEIQVEKN